MSIKDEISFGFIGDFCLSGFKKKSIEEIKDTFKTVNILNSKVDLSMANFEFTLTSDEDYLGKMSLPASMCADISSAGFNVFCLANNHIKDYGDKGLLFTKSFLEKESLKTVGVGKNIKEAVEPLNIVINNKQIAIINVTDATHYRAGDNSSGVAPLNSKKLINQVEEVAKLADVTVVIIHADLEFTNLPAPWRVKLSRSLVDHGAQIVVHHHSHTLQGIETYQGALIAYSLGNFIFPVHASAYMKNREGKVDDGAYLKVNVTFSDTNGVKLSYKLIPSKILSNDRLSIPSGIEKVRILNDIERYSEQLLNMKKMEQAYFHRCKDEMKIFSMGCYYALRKTGLISMFKYIGHHISTGQHVNWIRGFFSLGKL